ncbi:MAG: MFS transporter [Rhodoglobus sp.]
MRFSALRVPWYKGYLSGGILGMTGDHVEHAISYWVMWQLFQSPLLAGFAVISHWLPHLLFGVIIGGLADRYDCRRLVQLAQTMFILASVGWGVLIITGTLQPWNCVILLLLHGFAAALWGPAEQMMLYDIAGHDDTPSAVRLMATGLNLGMLLGPLIGAALLFTLGPGPAMFLNIALYLPFIIYLWRVPYTGHSRKGGAHRPRLGLRATFGVLGEIPRYPSILAVFVLQGATGLLIGTTLLPLLPQFGELLGQAESGLGYGALIAAMSAGAVIAGIALETIGGVRATPRLAIMSTAVFAASLVVFAASRNFPLSVAMLVLAGMGSLASASTSQTVVQLGAPADRRGRFLGAYSMIGIGLRVGSGLIVGVLGGILGPITAIGIDAAILLIVALSLLGVVLSRRRDLSDPVRPGDNTSAPGLNPAELL